MAGRRDDALAAALLAVARAARRRPNAEDAGVCSLATFRRENPPAFRGGYDPSGALAWLNEMEGIFCALDCTAAQRVRFGIHMLSGEAEDWWTEARRRFVNAGQEITWAVFTGEFLRKYYPEDVRKEKEVEFLELKQGNLSVAEYVARFTELAKLYSHFNGVISEFSKCIKFENGLRADIKGVIEGWKIRVFSELIGVCRVVEEYSDVRSRVVRSQGSRSRSRARPYESPAGGRKQISAEGKKISGGDAPSVTVCFRCGSPGHKRNGCRAGEQKCYHCGEGGHIRAQCPKRDGGESSGRVLTVEGSDAVEETKGT